MLGGTYTLIGRISMARLAGSVLLRNPDGSVGAPVAGARASFRPLEDSPSRVDVATNAGGRFVADLAAGYWLGAAIERDAGASPTWVRFRVVEGRPTTLNLFSDSALARLRGLAGSFPGEIGIYAEDLSSGATVEIGAEIPRYLASVAKVPIAVGCVDQMRDALELDEPVDLALQDHRDEGKMIAYEDLGANWTVRNLMSRMIGNSDTTATDVLSARYGIAEVNRRLGELTDGFSQLSSMIELDRRRYWLANPRFAEFPPFALSLYRRHGSTQWLDQLGLAVPEADFPEWDEYRADGREQASARDMGKLLAAIGKKRLFRESWKNDIMLDTVLAFGSPGRFMPSIDSNYSVNGKGGSHTDVTNQVGLVRSSSTSDPMAVLVVLTERHEPGISGRDVSAIIAEAGELALRALGFPLQLSTPNATSARPIVFLSPRPGLAFEQGDRPMIRWDTAGISGPLTLQLDDGRGGRRTISTNASDDGEWHSYQFPTDLPSSDDYRFRLTGTDTNGNQQTAASAWFAIGGSLHVTRPVAGEAYPPGAQVPIGWKSNGVNGSLTIRLLREGRVIDTLSTRARNDGEWHSWTVPRDLPRGKGYQIELLSNEDPEIWDRSSAFVVGGRIDVVAPSYEEVIDVGSKPRIRWMTENIVSPLRIELFGLGQQPLLTISNNARDDGEWHSWEVPDIAEGNYYRIRVSERDNEDIEGYSALFQLGTRYEWIVPSIDGAARDNSTLQSRPHFVAFGDTPTFRWRRIGADKGNLVIDLLRDGERIARISGNASDDGEWHSWSADDSLVPSSRYALALFARNKPTAMGRSVHFSIGARIAVSVGDKNIDTGDVVTIRWQTDGLNNTALVLDVVDEKGALVQSLGQTPNGATQRTWNVSTQASPRLARLRATSVEEPDVSGFSEWFDLN